MINNIYFLRVPTIDELRLLKKSDLYFIRSISCFPEDRRSVVFVDRIKESQFLVCLFEGYRHSIIIVEDLLWFDRKTLTFKGLTRDMKKYYIERYSLMLRNSN